jgi:homoserine kinase
MNKEIKVFASASVSNVACGFDIMGFAIDQPGDEVTLRLNEHPGVRITNICGDSGKLPADPTKNTAGAPIIALLKHLGINVGIDMEIHKKMPLGSGLGSSAASAVAAEGEKIASGAVHADNVAPCLYGGFVLIRGYNPIDVIEIPVPDELHCTIIHSQIEINTIEARRILPKEIPLIKAKTQWGNTAGLIAGLMKKDFGLISRSLVDVIIEPVRAGLIPGYEKIKNAAMEAGALGCNISGSGPAIFALSTSKEKAEEIGKAMQTEVDKIDLKNTVYISKINKQGPRVVEEKV